MHGKFVGDLQPCPRSLTETAGDRHKLTWKGEMSKETGWMVIDDVPSKESENNSFYLIFPHI